MITDLRRRLRDYLSLGFSYLISNLLVIPLVLLIMYLVTRGWPEYWLPVAAFCILLIALYLGAIIREMFFSGDFNEELVCSEYSDGNRLETLASSYGMSLPEDWHDRLQRFSSDSGIESASHGFKARFIWEKGNECPNGRAPDRGNILLYQSTALCYLCSDERANVYRISPEDCRKTHAEKSTFEKMARLIGYHECGHKISSIPLLLLYIFPFLHLIEECFAEMYAVKVSGYSREMIAQLYAVRAFDPPGPDACYLSFEKLRDFILRGHFTETEIRDIARARHAFPPGVWFTIMWYRNRGLFIESAYQ